MPPDVDMWYSLFTRSSVGKYELEKLKSSSWCSKDLHLSACNIGSQPSPLPRSVIADFDIGLHHSLQWCRYGKLAKLSLYLYEDKWKFGSHSRTLEMWDQWEQIGSNTYPPPVVYTRSFSDPDHPNYDEVGSSTHREVLQLIGKKMLHLLRDAIVPTHNKPLHQRPTVTRLIPNPPCPRPYQPDGRIHLMDAAPEIKLMILRESLLDAIGEWNLLISVMDDQLLAEGGRIFRSLHIPNNLRNIRISNANVLNSLFWCVSGFFRQEAKKEFWKVVGAVEHACQRVLVYKVLFADRRTEKEIIEEMEKDRGTDWVQEVIGYDGWDLFDLQGQMRCLCRNGSVAVEGYPLEVSRRDISSS